MGEITCSYCDHLNSHLPFHNGNPLCENCNKLLGEFCSICNEQICPNCHLWEHVESTYNEKGELIY